MATFEYFNRDELYLYAVEAKSQIKRLNGIIYKTYEHERELSTWRRELRRAREEMKRRNAQQRMPGF